MLELLQKWKNVTAAQRGGRTPDKPCSGKQDTVLSTQVASGKGTQELGRRAQDVMVGGNQPGQPQGGEAALRQVLAGTLRDITWE